MMFCWKRVTLCFRLSSILVTTVFIVFIQNNVQSYLSKTSVWSMPLEKDEDQLKSSQLDARKKWRRCLNQIQQRIVLSLSDIFTGSLLKNPVILVDPAFHENVGDNMLNYGEIILIEKFSTKHLECGVYQSMNKPKPCGDFSQYNRKSLSIFHAGGNWGDLWRRMQTLRLKKFRQLLRRNMTILGMPQSLHYEDENLKHKDSKELRRTVEDTIGIQQSRKQVVLTWRQANSYYEALELYPFADNRLVPDVAFMIGPIQNTNLWSKFPNQQTDFLFLLRDDKESTSLARRQRSVIQTLMSQQQSSNGDNITFKISDWNDRLDFYSPNSIATPVQQVHDSGVFDYNDRFASAVAMFASAKVIITDRLHGTIFSFLSYKPHVYLDQISTKIKRTLDVAFNSSEECGDKEALKHMEATTLSDAVRKGVIMLRKYY